MQMHPSWSTLYGPPSLNALACGPYVFPRRRNGAKQRGSRAGPQQRDGTPILYPPPFEAMQGLFTY